MEDVLTKLKDNLGSRMSDMPDERFQMMKQINKAKEMTENKKSPEYLEFLNNQDDIIEIYKLIKNKKLSANQIRSKIKNYLKEPEELKNFLKAIINTKSTKKEENTEATGAGAAGGYSMPLFSTTKGDIVKTVREQLEVEGGEETEGQVKKSETKEATSVSSSGQYNQPSIWAKSMSKKDFRGYSKAQIPGGKFVQVKKKCTKFPYCNQGDIKALKIFENESVQNAIESVSGKYGMDKNYISEIVFQQIRKSQK
jgi:hypothetical protein